MNASKMEKESVMFVIEKDGDFKGEVTAVFTGSVLPKFMKKEMGCYSHVGQHSSCSREWVEEKTRMATPMQYNKLLAEMKEIGHSNLEVINEWNIPFHRNPTRGEVKSGYGVTHYVDVPLYRVMKPEWKIFGRHTEGDHIYYYN